MTLFNKVFSTRTLLQIICVLGAVIVGNSIRLASGVELGDALS